jgi:uncharacterized protein
MKGSALIIGLGTLLNVAAILVGSAIGVLFGGRLPERTNRTVTDALALVVLVIGGLNIVSLQDASYVEAVGSGFTLLIVLAALLLGGIIGSLARIEERLEAFGAWLQSRFVRGGSTAGSDDADAGIDAAAGRAAGSRARFGEGFVNATLIFCVGPMAILGALSDGLGRGIETLTLKSTLDGFTSMAFAATLGWGVAASAISVAVWQGLLTVLAALVGSLLSSALIASITATGGVLLLGVGFRMLKMRAVPVGDLLPALILAPIFTALVAAIR